MYSARGFDPGNRPKWHRTLKGCRIVGLKTCKNNVLGIPFSEHIDNRHCFDFEKQSYQKCPAFSGAPSGRVAGGGGFLGLKPQAESVLPLRGTEPPN
jgi:hypothetical protein